MKKKKKESRPSPLLFAQLLATERMVVQYSDKFMHGIVLYCVHITILNKNITIKNEAKQWES